MARIGRIASHTHEAEISRSKARQRHAAQLKAWDAKSLPTWLTEQAYREKIQPRLAGIAIEKICSTLGISVGYATDIRAGGRVPHPRHWQALARLVAVSFGLT